ncbi:MAG: hypothetical protein QM783_10160 [Phycisphaerales bacterium]
MVGEDEQVYLIVEPAKLDEAVRALIRVGVDRLEGWFDATKVADLAAAGVPLETTDEVTVAEAQGLIAAGEEGGRGRREVASRSCSTRAAGLNSRRASSPAR